MLIAHVFDAFQVFQLFRHTILLSPVLSLFSIFLPITIFPPGNNRFRIFFYYVLLEKEREKKENYSSRAGTRSRMATFNARSSTRKLLLILFSVCWSRRGCDIKTELVVDIYASGYTCARIEARRDVCVWVKDGDSRPIAGQPFLRLEERGPRGKTIRGVSVNAVYLYQTVLRCSGVGQ